MFSSKPAQGQFPLGVRIYSDGRTKESKQSFLSSLVAICTLTLYTGWIQIFFCLMLLSPFNQWVLLTVTLLLSTLLLPAAPVLWPAFCKLWVFQTWRHYFSFSYMFEEHILPKKHYVFVEFPHGVFPMGPLLGGTECQRIFPGLSVFALAASSVFRVPFWRHFVAWIGCVEATSKNFRWILKKGSVAVIVGGIAEMYMQHPKQEQVVLRDRKGFVRVAMEEGSDGIVPVYHFGNSQVLDFYPQSFSAWSRKYRAAVGFLYGQWGLPLPRRREIFMVCGKPIPVPKMSKDDPQYDEVLEKTHLQVIKALQDLYDNHKAEYGWADRPLQIV